MSHVTVEYLLKRGHENRRKREEERRRNAEDVEQAVRTGVYRRDLDDDAVFDYVIAQIEQELNEAA